MRRALVLLLTVLVLVPVGCSRQQGDEESFCELAPDVDDLFSLLQGFESADPEELDRRFDSGLERFRALERSAPREIKPDVAELVDIVEEVIEAVRSNRNDRSAIAADLADLQGDHPGAAASALRVVQYVNETCGVELEGGPPASDDESSPSVTGDPGTEVEGVPGTDGGTTTDENSSTTGG